MVLSDTAAARVEGFLAAHPTGPLVVCVGSASVAGIVWLDERSRGRPVTLLIGDMRSRNFAKATDVDRRTAAGFVQRGDVTVLSWYRTDRSNQGRSQSHLKVWACCDNTGAPQAFLVGSANLTVAGLYENVEVMALADASEHTYLTSTLNQFQHKAWDATQRLQELIEHGQAISERHHPQRSPSSHASASSGAGKLVHTSRRQTPVASTGCGPQALAVASQAAAGATLLVRVGRRYRQTT